MLPSKFIEKIHNYEITLDEAINYQTELQILINKLNNGYNSRYSKKIEEKNKVLKSAKELFYARENIVNYFKQVIFPYKENVFKTKGKKLEEESEEKIKDDFKKIIKYIENESKGINYDLFKDYFDFSVPSALAKKII